jgi:hypothetical protein
MPDGFVWDEATRTASCKEGASATRHPVAGSCHLSPVQFIYKDIPIDYHISPRKD